MQNEQDGNRKATSSAEQRFAENGEASARTDGATGVRDFCAVVRIVGSHPGCVYKAHAGRLLPGDACP